MQLDHIAMTVEDIARSVKWYTENFNAETKYVDETWALLEIGQTRIALTIPSQHPPHIAFTVSKLEDVPGMPKTHRDGSISSYVQDPDGNSIEYIYWPNA